MPTPTKKGDAKPLPLGDTLHDLAVLRASDMDLAAFLPAPAPSDQSERMTAKQTDSDAKSTSPSEVSAGDSPSERDRLVERSYEYVREGRTAIRLLRRGDVDSQGARVDSVRGELEEILSGLEDKQ